MLHFVRNGGKCLTSTTYRSITSYPTLNKKRNVINEIQCRGIGTKDIFTSEPLKNFTIPEVPLPPLPSKTVTELIAEKQSILSELGLFDWYKPTGYLRYLMEYSHLNFDIPWWGAIITTTITLRLLLFYVPLMTHRNVAIQSQYRDNLAEYNRKIQEAQKESDFRKTQIILVEQKNFMKSKGIDPLKQALTMVCNGGIFITQFWAIKKFVTVSYPGFETGGLLWLQNLTIPDPLYILPLATGLTTYGLIKSGSEIDVSSGQMGGKLKLFLLYGFPVISFGATCFFPSAIGIYWLTTNCMSILYSNLFKITAVRKFLKIPKFVPAKEKPSFKESLGEVRNLFATKNETPISEIRQKDMSKFSEAGKRSPYKRN